MSVSLTTAKTSHQLNVTHLIIIDHLRHSLSDCLEDIAHLSVYVPAEAGGETLYVESEATLVGQALQKHLRPFVISLLLLLVFPVAARQHHHVTLRSVQVMVTITT